MHLGLTVECITSGLHLSVFLIRSHPPPAGLPPPPPQRGLRSTSIFGGRSLIKRRGRPPLWGLLLKMHSFFLFFGT